MRQVVVTGIGIVSCIGNNKDEVMQYHKIIYLRKHTPTRYTIALSVQLQPNDNNYFVSRQLVLTLYLLDRIDDIKELMSEKIKNDDYNLGNIEILVTYSAIEAEEGNIEEAKEIWERVEKTGLKLVQLKSYRKGSFFEKIKPHLEPLALLQSLK